jgi:hypothetical protein
VFSRCGEQGVLSGSPSFYRNPTKLHENVEAPDPVLTGGAEARSSVFIPFGGPQGPWGTQLPAGLSA